MVNELITIVIVSRHSKKDVELSDNQGNDRG